MDCFVLELWFRLSLHVYTCTDACTTHSDSKKGLFWQGYFVSGKVKCFHIFSHGQTEDNKLLLNLQHYSTVQYSSTDSVYRLRELNLTSTTSRASLLLIMSSWIRTLIPSVLPDVWSDDISKDTFCGQMTSREMTEGLVILKQRRVSTCPDGRGRMMGLVPAGALHWLLSIMSVC